MGRLFVTNIEGPSYKCKHCKVVELVAYDPSKNTIIPPFANMPNVRKLYMFLKFFNVVIRPDEEAINSDHKVSKLMHNVFCIACGSFLGYYFEEDAGTMYNEGTFFINRAKLTAPNAESDDDGDDDGDDDDDDGDDEDDENQGNEEDQVMIQA
ncbi:unnamed protein product [Cochlearia groenlandica]